MAPRDRLPDERPSDHPFVDRPMDDAALAAHVASAAAASWGLPDPTLLRRGMNALFVAGEVVIRVGHSRADPSLGQALAEVLAANGVRTVEPVGGAALTVAGVAVTGWRRLIPTDAPIDWAEVGRMVRRVHELEIAVVPAGYPVPAPSVFPWWDFDALLAGTELDDAARVGLTAAVERHRGWQERVAADPVLCHGDVHPGNVVMTDSGPVLLDWDLMCVASSAWDHAMLTTYATRWGGPVGTYEAYAAGYGRSFADDPLASALAELRDVAATLMRVRAGRTDRAAATEAERRLRFWRGDPDAPIWRAQ